MTWNEMRCKQVTEFRQAHDIDCFDPPFVIEKVDYATGNTKFADFDSETTMDEDMTPETTPRSVCPSLGLA